MALSWSARRQLLYYVVAAIVGAILVLILWEWFFVRTPTCFDGRQDGLETGVDCGGTCSLVCEDVAKIPHPLWWRSFNTSTNTYTAAAYIRNDNPNTGAHGVHYTFKLYDKNNFLMAERDGVTDIPPKLFVPIVETNITVGGGEVAHTDFTFAEVPTWEKVTNPLPPLTLTDEVLAPDASRLSATLNTDSIKDVAKVAVIALLFDNAGTARAASKTIVNKVPHKSSVPIVFTWPQGVPNVVSYEITILPSF
jgi:hypothetical protein